MRGGIKMKWLPKIYDTLYQPVAWTIVTTMLLFCLWGMVDDFNIGCHHSAWRLLWFFLIVLSPLVAALVFFKPRTKTS